MTALAPYAVLTGPGPGAPALHNLVVSAQEVDESSEEWLAGFTWDPENCIVVEADAPDCENIVDPAYTLSDPLTIGTNDPSDTLACPIIFPVRFMLALERITRVPPTSNAPQGFRPADVKKKAEQMLDAAFSKALELQFWTDALGTGNQHLAASGVPTLSDGGTTGFTPTRALGQLEQAIADMPTGGRGMIHATPELVAIWSMLGVVKEDGPRLVTLSRGTIVVPGAGYDGSGPEGHARAEPTQDKQWAYATGLVYVRQTEVTSSPENFSEAFDRLRNRFTFRAQKWGAANFDPCYGPVAVEIELGAA